MTNQAAKSGGRAKVAILGAGSWGGTLAKILCLSGNQVSLWTRDSQKAANLSQERVMDKPLPFNLPEAIEISADLEKCLHNKEIVLFCCTSQSLRSLAGSVKTALKSEKPVLVSAVKGLELETFMRMSEILSAVLPELSVATLSGPNLAAEILNGLPTASVIACKEATVARLVQEKLSVPSLRLYWNTDVAGVELGGSLKNVIAIAAGGVDGLELGYNAKAALITRGLAETTRLAVLLGAQPATMAGLAGLGDLVATCMSPLSRNYQLGYKIARGTTLKTAESELKAVAEGVSTTFAVCELAKKLNIELPIAQEVEASLKNEGNPQKAIMNLMTRPLVSE
ncbi:MAG: NAD(P)-dependent glycerol-3-phosphate dehydrogenase [Candidatus Obscuribacterales bacterium]|nr:NAD(P)-dependent glycerol-3-phosphate dehydrogenase [Candidatus Obscuribacterales bacterium]